MVHAPEALPHLPRDRGRPRRELAAFTADPGQDRGVLRPGRLAASRPGGRACWSLVTPLTECSPAIHSTTVMSGFPFSTIYVASSAARPGPTFLAEWIVPAGMNRTSRALRTTGGLPCTVYSHVPSRT